MYKLSGGRKEIPRQIGKVVGEQKQVKKTPLFLVYSIDYIKVKDAIRKRRNTIRFMM
ncbi:MAG: hypothetical protein G5Z42_06465 [Caldisphaeraceae archaeon]|nr:hypothetical protein [Caldisphaeraceae archaeon]MEB3798441.1 hypothetical protein [Caldisphaeraceae archaeon]